MFLVYTLQHASGNLRVCARAGRNIVRRVRSSRGLRNKRQHCLCDRKHRPAYFATFEINKRLQIVYHKVHLSAEANARLPNRARLYLACSHLWICNYDQQSLAPMRYNKICHIERGHTELHELSIEPLPKAIQRLRVRTKNKSSAMVPVRISNRFFLVLFQFTWETEHIKICKERIFVLFVGAWHERASANTTVTQNTLAILDSRLQRWLDVAIPLPAAFRFKTHIDFDVEGRLCAFCVAPREQTAATRFQSARYATRHTERIALVTWRGPIGGALKRNVQS